MPLSCEAFPLFPEGALRGTDSLGMQPSSCTHVQALEGHLRCWLSLMGQHNGLSGRLQIAHSTCREVQRGGNITVCPRIVCKSSSRQCWGLCLCPWGSTRPGHEQDSLLAW